MSPSSSGRLSGMPWQITSFTEVQIDFGKPVVVERARVAAEPQRLRVGDLVERVGRDARADRVARHAEHAALRRGRRAEPLELLRASSCPGLARAGRPLEA